MKTLTSLVKALTADALCTTIFSLEDKPSDIIQNKSASNTYSKYILTSNISVDNDAQLFETPRESNYSITNPGAHILLCFYGDNSFETPRINNHSVTAPSLLVFLGSDSAQSFETPQK